MQCKLQQNLSFTGLEAIRENMCVIINICEFTHFEMLFEMKMMCLLKMISCVGINPTVILKFEVQLTVRLWLQMLTRLLIK